MPNTVLLRSSRAQESCPRTVARVAPQGPVPQGGRGHGIGHARWASAPETPSLGIPVLAQ